MPTNNNLLLPFLILAAAIVAGLIWVASDVFVLFVVAFFLAYLFDPFVRQLERHGLSRSFAALLITATLVVVVVGAGAFLGPLVYSQSKELLHTLRSLANLWADRLSDSLMPFIPGLKHHTGDGVVGLLKQPSNQPVSTIAGPIAVRVFSGSLAVASMVGLALLVPIITYYLLKDWRSMSARVLTAVPPHRRAEVRQLTAEIHSVLSAFLHGQSWICAIDAVLFSAGLLASGLQYALVIGVIAGALKFLPYVGTLIGLTIALGMALSQSGWSGWLLAGVALTFACVELIENMLYPRLVGSRVRLPPAMVIFAVLLGGKLLGVVGVFLAVPTFAVARVAIAFWLRHRTHEEAEGQSPEPSRPPSTSAPPLKSVENRGTIVLG